MSEVSFEYAQGLFDEWVAYTENCFKEHKRFLGFTMWLGAVKKLPNCKIEEVIKLTLTTHPDTEVN